MFQKNLNLVSERFPYLNLSQNRTGSQPDLLLTVSLSKTGSPVAQVTRNNHRVFLNSSYDPELDARRWVENNLDKAAGHCILCGAGFFYHVKVLLESDTVKKLVIYEPSPAILQAAMHEIDLMPIFAHDNFLLLTGMDYDEMVKGALDFFNSGLIYTTTDIQFKTLTAYSELFHDEINIFQAKLREFFRLIQMNLTTTDAYAKQWLSNAFATFSNSVNSPVIRHYFGQFKNIPAIVVSAGPSLEKNIHLVNAIKGNAVVICAGSSIRAMKRNGVSPHFLVAVDGHEINNKVYGDLDLSDSYLVYNFRFWHEVATKFPGRKILMKVDAESLPDLLIAQNGGYEIGSLKSGFSVSHTSVNLAFQLGCNPIILIGQDLAYSPTKRYAEGQISSSQKYFKPGQIPPNSFFTKDIYGQDIMTDYELDSFRMLFERMIETSYQGKVNIINATEGGVHIKGTTDRILEEVIVEYCRNDRRISQRIESLYERGLKEIRTHRINPMAYCSQLKIVTNRAIIKMMELLDELQALRKRNFNSEFAPAELDSLLEKITNAYDQALNYKEFQVLLKDVQVTALSVNKARLGELGEIKNQADYDRKLQVYLNIIADTQKTLEFVMECIGGVLNQPDNTTHIQVPMGESRDIAAIEQQIKQGLDLQGLRRTLETALRDQTALERGNDLYLYGLLLQKAKQTNRAIDILEEATKVDPTQVNAYFVLYRIYYRTRNYSKALESLEHCCQQDFKTKYCRKMQLKINYKTQNWVAANNLAVEYASGYSSKKAVHIVRIECCCHMGLHLEAKKLYQSLIANYNISSKIAGMLGDLLATATVTEYEQTYRINRRFFMDAIGLNLPEYVAAQYKVCRFLSGEYVYDSQSGHILIGVDHATVIDIKLTLQDCLAIYNTDNAKIFEHLAETLERSEDAENHQQIALIPIYIIEDNMGNWCFLAQLFDFQRLQGWRNLHYYIAPPGGITETFMVEDAPWPNVLYGTSAEEFTKALLKIKEAKDRILQQRVQELEEYYNYRAASQEQPQKILIITSIKEELLWYYGQALQAYLRENGFDCRLYIESTSYHRFTPYGDAQLLDEFRPDLVFHLFGVQEEFEVFKSLNIPFVSWLVIDKQFNEELTAHCSNQQILITGNLNAKNALISKGYRMEQIRTVTLPVFPAQLCTAAAVLPDQGIAIFADLDDLEMVINDLGTVVYGLLFIKTHQVSKSIIMAILKAVYFQIYAQLNNEELRTIDLPIYEKVLSENFQRYKLNLTGDQYRLLAGFVKEEFENLIFKLLQVKWVVNEFKDYNVALYGTGWEKDPAYKTVFKGELNSITYPEEYRDLVLKNKVNLWLRTRLKNRSYMQPDLINGISAGGFFLTGKWLDREHEVESVLSPFYGLFDSYGSKAELVEKLDYFLKHQAERIKRAKELQSYILEHFNISKIIEKCWRI